MLEGMGRFHAHVRRNAAARRSSVAATAAVGVPAAGDLRQTWALPRLDARVPLELTPHRLACANATVTAYATKFSKPSRPMRTSTTSFAICGVFSRGDVCKTEEGVRRQAPERIQNPRIQNSGDRSFLCLVLRFARRSSDFRYLRRSLRFFF